MTISNSFCTHSPVYLLLNLSLLLLVGSSARLHSQQGAERLLRDLACGACHAGVPAPAEIWDQAPSLSFAGDRYNPAYLFSYLSNPVRIRQHIGSTRMPAFILDDVRPLRSVTKEVLERPLHLFEIPATYQYQVKQMDGYHFPGDAFFRGETRPYGALITYSLSIPKDSLRVPPSADEEEQDPGEGERADQRRDTARVQLEVLDASGKVIRRFMGPAERGMNRVAWNLRIDGPRVPRVRPPRAEETFFTPQGSEVLPGTYTIRIKAGRHEASQTVEVMADPRVNIPFADRQQNFEMRQRIARRIDVAAEAVSRIVRTRRSIDAVLEQVRSRNDDAARELRRDADALKKKLTEVADRFVDEPNRIQGIVRNPNTVTARLTGVVFSVSSSWDAPNATQMTYLRQAEALLEEVLKEFNRVFAEEVAAFAQKVETAKLSFFPEHRPLDMEWRRMQR